MAIYDDTKENKIAIYDKGIDRFHSAGSNMDYDKASFSLRAGKVYEPKIKMEEPLAVEIAHFLDCIEKGIECWTGPEHAAKVVKILTDCGKSSEVLQADGKRLDSGACEIPAEFWR
jgi:predicted dehydrogenase